MIPFKLILSNLFLKDFKGFKGELNIDFDPNLTVFIGENGAGKTSILDALGVHFSILIEQYAEPYTTHHRHTFGKYDIHNTCELGQRVESNALFSLNENPITTELSFGKMEEMRGDILIDADLNETEFIPDFQGLSFFDEIKQNPFSFPVLVYYPCAMAGQSSSMETERLSTDIYSTYENALQYNSLDFKVFRKWFAWQQNKNSSFLSHVKSAILQLLNDENSQYQDVIIDWEVPEGQFVISKNNEKIVEQQFSSGEKTMIALIGDLCRRLTMANPNSENPLHGQGVVLIDEIDLHLHPKWQRKIVPKFRDIFPNVQFVITTHSPVILTEIYSKHIRVLEDFQVYGFTESFGHSEEEMLDKMGATSKQKQQIKEAHRLLAQNKIEEAKQKRNQINVEGQFAPLVEIDLFIKRKEQN